jgi:hypothetical protein
MTGKECSLNSESSHDFHIQVAIWGSLESKEKPKTRVEGKKKDREK